MTKIIGLTGGIGSGKTTIAKYFLSLGVPIYIADDEARKIMQSEEIIIALKNSFGSEIFEDGTLKRQSLANIVFNNPEKLTQLNAIVHPAVRTHFQEWLDLQLNNPYIIYEAAILFESGNYKKCDQIICVTAPLESRIQRVITRDGSNKELVLQRINSQWTDEQRISMSDFIIENEDLDIAKQKVAEIHKILMIKQNDN